MAKPIGSPRNITSAQDQWEILRTEIGDGVIRFHRQRVTRDNLGQLVGSPGPIETVSATIAGLPVVNANAVSNILAYGDSL